MAIDLILGTAGHIDHGKTSLIRALTGIDCDRLPEEKSRGITIELGFAHLELPPYRLGIVDVPGHERFVRQMLAGATGMDVAMLVVAADDSAKQQTREHLDVLRLLDLKAGVIALTRSIAEETKGYNITANTVLPSIIDTPSNRKSMGEKDVDKWVKKESLAEVICYLASERAGDIRGAAIPVYGNV